MRRDDRLLGTSIARIPAILELSRSPNCERQAINEMRALLRTIVTLDAASITKAQLELLERAKSFVKPPTARRKFSKQSFAAKAR